MLLVIDIGNTNIKNGLFDNDRLVHSWRFHTDTRRAADEYGIQMEAVFQHFSLKTEMVDGIILSSVIPTMNYTMEHLCNIFFPQAKVMLVNSAMKLNVTIAYDMPAQLGSDRICNAVAAYHSYGGPCVVVDFGTATSFTVVSEKGVLLGGLICPGIMVAADALVEKAAMLHKVEYVKPPSVIGTNTRDGIQSGVIRGYVGQVDYILRQIDTELGMHPKNIATGGMSGMIANETDRIDLVNPILTLEGLARIYTLNS